LLVHEGAAHDGVQDEQVAGAVRMENRNGKKVPRKVHMPRKK